MIGSDKSDATTNDWIKWLDQKPRGKGQILKALLLEMICSLALKTLSAPPSPSWAEASNPTPTGNMGGIFDIWEIATYRIPIVEA